MSTETAVQPATTPVATEKHKMRQKIEDMPTWKILGIIGSIVVVAVSVGMWAASVANSGTDAVKSINALREEQSQHWDAAAIAAVKAADEQKMATAEVSRATQAVAVELAKVSPMNSSLPP